MPRTLVHGEFHPSNVLVGSERIWAVDWETAGVAPGLVDLAALTAGWGEAERRAISEAYRDEVGAPAGFAVDGDLACCRLHVAVKWLGWSPTWTPPREHRHDWVAEAASAVDELRR